jgi:hypothetical protein
MGRPRIGDRAMTGTERSRRSRARHRPAHEPQPVRGSSTGPSIVRPESCALTDPAEDAAVRGVLDFADGQAQPQLCLYRLISRLMAAYQRRQGDVRLAPPARMRASTIVEALCSAASKRIALADKLADFAMSLFWRWRRLSQTAFKVGTGRDHPLADQVAPQKHPK